ncbi:MAG: hypothetical protein A2144_00105 [Chloroflexi bacterium RBG_16_50_9]|nr:MAG: hypothetical protein A2144_00105 [Chloroflexi bacterium RBG_16_50_9]
MLSVIIPAYNEAEKIVQTTEELISTLDSFHASFEIILVDDGSKDNTLEKARCLADHHSRVKVCNYRRNRGKGYALKHGFEYTKGDPVIFLDADYDLPPHQLGKFIENTRKNNFDILVGSKNHPLSQVKVTFCRKCLSKCYNLYVKQLFGLGVSDTQVGLKLFRRKVLEQVFPKLLLKSYAFDVELLASAKRQGYKICEAPVELNCTSNRIVIRGVWRMFWDTITTYYRMNIRHYYD